MGAGYLICLHARSNKPSNGADNGPLMDRYPQAESHRLAR
jgi:hypothetical protein